MKSEDAYWDNLGVAWRASHPDIEQVAPRLHARLRRQSFVIRAALAFGMPLCCAGMVLAVFTIWGGWTTGAWNFVTRGIAIAVISLLLIYALASFFASRKPADALSLTDMLAIASTRLRRTLFLIRTAIVGSVIAAVFGIFGAAIRVRAGSPPRLSPIIDLIIIALIISFLWMYARSLSAESRKFDYLQRVLGADK